VKAHLPLVLFCLVVVGACPLMATLTLSISPNPAGPQPLGTTITWTATVSGDPDPNPVYEYTFSAEPVGAPVQVRRGYGHSTSWTFTPTAFEGTFTIGSTVKNVHANTSASTTASYIFNSRLGGKSAAVNTTNHPLVALFSGAYCAVPNLMRIRFTPTTVPTGGITSPMLTTPIPCRFNEHLPNPDRTSMNFELGGMYPSTTYMTHYEVITPTGAIVSTGGNLPFTTGAIPSTLFFPVFTPVGTSTDTGEPIVLHNAVSLPVNGHIYTSAAVDLAGNILWYNTQPPARTETGGNSWGFSNGGNTDIYVTGIREVDLAGNPVLETTVGAVNEQLVALGKRPITSFHHEVRRITTPNGLSPSGDIVLLGNSEQICTNCQGGTVQNPVDVLGDQILVLDQNMNLIWNFDTFANLDINQPAILGETCMQPGGGGCEPFNKMFQVANDWLHSNSVQYTAYDGNFIFSTRHQDAVFKVNFANGTGDGHIIWKLGNGPIGGVGGTKLPSFTLFTVGTGGPDLGYPWFSHQHDAEVELGGHLFNGFRVLTLFDDGNTRQAFYNPNADSRCQLLAINESALVANLNTNGDMLNYSFALGSAQLLKNGNIHCDSGFIGGFQQTVPATTSTEVDQKGNFVYSMDAAEDSYRTFRMQDLYTADNP
jgi:arylsulfate sulfotransferase